MTFQTVILGHLTPDERKSLVAKAFDAIEPGGAVRAYGLMPYPERVDLLAWMAKAGFGGASIHPLAHGRTLVVGRKESP